MAKYMDSAFFYFILALAKSGTLARPCDHLIQTGLSRIAIEETREAGYILQERPDKSCQLNFLGFGEKDSIQKDPAKVEAIMADKTAVRSFNVHSHPLENVSYFSEGVPYNGEIMFVDEKMINSRRLSKEEFDKLVKRVKIGQVPGFNLAPPQLQDLLVAVNSPGEIFVVISSGGFWTYSLAEGADSHNVSEKIYSLSSYAQIFEAASMGHGRAQQLKDNILKDPELSSFIKTWQECSLELRAPNTDKQIYIKRWIHLMKEIGVEMTFTAFYQP